ncbi:MAG: ABC transporter substrate-binding protein [Rickettsiaceae bacterium]|nr:ABC transporter substrate-binding protein [Rickettsiaceae bacterium]
MRLFFLITVCIVIITTILYNIKRQELKIPLVAIANYGPHSTLNDTIEGIKEGMNQLGYIENQTIRYKIFDANFEISAISQIVTHLKSYNPQIFVAISTPVSQIAANHIQDISLICVNVTDPVAIESAVDSDNIFIVSDRPDLESMLIAIKKSMPNLSRVGVMFSTGEANDVSSLNAFEEIALKLGFEVIAIPLEHSRDAKMRVSLLKNKADLIYLGSSGAVQSSLPVIAEFAKTENIPIISFDNNTNVDNKLIADFPEASYHKIGINTAKMIDRLLRKDSQIKKIIYPNDDDLAEKEIRTTIK